VLVKERLRIVVVNINFLKIKIKKKRRKKKNPPPPPPPPKKKKTEIFCYATWCKLVCMSFHLQGSRRIVCSAEIFYIIWRGRAIYAFEIVTR